MPASRTTAKTSASMSSSVSPAASRSRNSMVLARRASSSSACISGSRALTRSAVRRRREISRSLPSKSVFRNAIRVANVFSGSSDSSWWTTGLDRRKRHDKGRPFVLLRPHAYGPLMRFGDLSGHIEADPRTADALIAGVAGSAETGEQALDLGLRDPDPAIADLDLCPLVDQRDAYLDRPARILQRIGHQVVNDVPETI